MKKKTRRLITLLLAISLTVGMTAGLTAGANGGTMDLDGDGRITIHDAQLLQESQDKKVNRKLTDDQKVALADYTFEDLLNKLLGKSYTPTQSGGVYQLSSLKDLYFLRDNSAKGYSFKLTKNIDLDGMNWEPIDQFKGTFDGGNFTISNAVITTGRQASNAASGQMQNTGFFAEIMAGAEVKNLNLSHVEIELSTNASEYIQFAGLLCGTNRGTVTGCYTHGKITDRREKVTIASTSNDGDVVYLGALIGRCVGDGQYSTVSGVYATEPTTAKGERYTLETKDTKVNDNAVQIAAQLAVDMVARSNTKVALCGWGRVNSGNPVEGPSQFQEISGTYGVSDAMQVKQDRVVDYMYEEGTVKWQTPTDLKWWKSADDLEESAADSSWPAKKNGTTITYTGIPFNSYHNGLERFQYVAKQNEDGIYILDSSLANMEDADWYNSKVTSKSADFNDSGTNGWVRYIGNDCSSSISWAWLQISPVNASRDLKLNLYTTKTGVFADSCRHLFAYSPADVYNYGTTESGSKIGWSDYYGHAHGIVKIGNYNFFGTDKDGVYGEFMDATTACETDNNNDGVVSYLDGKYATTSADIWEWNADYTKSADNQQYHTLYETYGQARKGDAIHCWFTGDHNDTYSEDTDGDGKLDIREDLNSNGVLDTVETKWGKDLNGNGKIDATVLNEDTNGNRELDEGEDTNGNKKLDTDEDVDGDGHLDVHEDQNNNKVIDTHRSRVWEGHMRLIAEDPVIIRNRDGYIDITSSYLITHGHGGGVKARRSNASNTWTNHNSWALYQKYFLVDLGYTAGNGTCRAGNLINDGSNWGTSCCYLPITCQALRTETEVSNLTEALKWDSSATYELRDLDGDGKVDDKWYAPYYGKAHTTYALSEVTVKVYSDADAKNELASYTACALPEGGLRSTNANVRFTPQYLREANMQWLFPDMQSDLLSKGLQPLKTYYYRVILVPVNDSYRLNSQTGKYEWVENASYTGDIRSFTYEAPAA